MATNAPSDHIYVTGLRVMGRHGVLPEEQDRAQPFEIDLDLAIDLSAAGAGDDLTDTVDYGTVAEAVASIVATESYALLERLAQRIAEACRADARVTSVTVTVKKLRPPVPLALDHVAVRVTR